MGEVIQNQQGGVEPRQEQRTVDRKKGCKRQL